MISLHYMCRFAITCVQPATRTTPHATPNSLHIRQAHCYIARLGNISNPREGRVLQLVRARCVSISAYQLNKDTTHYQGCSTGQRSVPAVRRLPLCSETLAVSLLERVKVTDRRAMRDLDSREPMPKLQARHAKERQRNWEPIARKEKAHVPLAL